VNFTALPVGKPVHHVDRDSPPADYALRWVPQEVKCQTATMRRLFPDPAGPVLSVRECYEVPRPKAPGNRPWIAVCMVSSLDGAIAVEGRSQGLSNPNDTEVLLTLRDIADVILVGAGTVRDEVYGPPRTPGQRVAVVTNSGRVDFTSPLFTSGAGFLVCPENLPELPVDTLRCGAERVDLPQAVSRLSEVVPDLRLVQAEGGGMLNGALATADLIDELNLTISPQLVGGTSPRLMAADALQRSYDLAHLLIDEQSFLFSRWVRRPF
jgi:riboflavin biosynthesis pyrimidine reductase